MLHVLETERVLRLTAPGRLVPWLGPALRGLAARRFKRRVCIFPPAEQETTWRYCKGCPHQAVCPYGQTVEPDPPSGAAVVAGQDDAVRPLVIAPAFPAPEVGVPGTELRVRVSFAGEAAARHADEFWAAVADAGRDPGAGLDPDRTTFEVWPPPPPEPPARWLTAELPLVPETPAGPVASVEVHLTSPLFLRQSGGLVENPTFGDLLRASLRTVGRLCAYHGRGVPDQAFRALKEAAEAVTTRGAAFERFRQRKWSNRSQQAATLSGVVGKATYGPVPRGLVPWLTWGGRLHVGVNRVAGAGGWQVLVHGEEERRTPNRAASDHATNGS
jgi:hypothetical protein